MTCILESFYNHDIDGNKNVKKAIVLAIIIKNTSTLQVNKKIYSLIFQHSMGT